MFRGRTPVPRKLVPTLHALLARRPEFGATKDERMLAFAQRLEPETASRLIRTIDTGAIAPEWLVVECADALGVEPSVFAEWHMHRNRRLYDVRTVGFNAALDNLAAWVEEQRGERR